jgi:UDP-3-O-[3-hydroxymyristoyl] glucosamine N-acyltransferase
MDIKIKDAAELIGGSIFGNADSQFNNVAKIEEAAEGELTFLYHPAYEKYFDTTKAAAIIVKPGFAKTRNDITYIEVENPNVAFQKIVTTFFNPELQLVGIDDSAFIDASAKLGNDTAVGKNVVISAGCKIGSRVKIFHNTVIGENVEIGNDTLLYPNITIRENCRIGNFVIIHSGTVIGSDGFGYTPDEKGIYQKIPQIGNVVIEDNVEIGSNVSVDRAALGSTIIMEGAKIDNLVQIAHNVTIGKNTVISAQTGVSGSTKVGNNSILAGQVGLVGHIEIGDKVIIGAQSGVSKSITTPGTYSGSPAQELKNRLRLEVQIRNLPKYADRIKELEKKIAALESFIQKLNKGDNS